MGIFPLEARAKEISQSTSARASSRVGAAATHSARLARGAGFTARSRAMIARGEKPPFHAVYLIHGDLARDMAANGARDLAAGRIIPIEILCRA